MYAPEKVAESIKNRAKERNIQIKDMLLDLGLNKNTLSTMYSGSMLKGDSLARIADYLDCSVDYLLGRTDNPQLLKKVEILQSFLDTVVAGLNSADEIDAAYNCLQQ